MENINKKDSFHYTYSASEQDEIKKIRQKYQPQEEDKMARLRRLDEGVTRKATIASLVIGIVGALVLGCGMSLAMTDIGEALGFAGIGVMVVGIIIGVIGIVVLSFAYPVYNRIVKTERAKIAPEVIRLTDELMK